MTQGLGLNPPFVMMHLHLGRLCIFILFWAILCLFPDLGMLGFFYTNPLGRVPGVRT